MPLIDTVVQKAKTSPLYLMLLNWGLRRKIPFNRPHGIRILKIADHSIETAIPYKRNNYNHIKGLHACSLATLAEFTTGFLLLSKLDLSTYRLIMSSLSMEYHYQGKAQARAFFFISEEWFEKEINVPIQEKGVVSIDCEVKIVDINQNHLATGIISWQIKDWKKVKTAVS
jgi:hypothetical protein